MDYKFTEKMENDLDLISNGKLKRDKFVKTFWNNFEPIKNNYEKIAEENPRNPSEYNFLKDKYYLFFQDTMYKFGNRKRI